MFNHNLLANKANDILVSNGFELNREFSHKCIYFHKDSGVIAELFHYDKIYAHHSTDREFEVGISLRLSERDSHKEYTEYTINRLISRIKGAIKREQKKVDKAKAHKERYIKGHNIVIDVLSKHGIDHELGISEVFDVNGIYRGIKFSTNSSEVKEPSDLKVFLKSVRWSDDNNFVELNIEKVKKVIDAIVD